MKYGDSTQIIVTEYDRDNDKFRVINRIEIPKGQFTLDNGVKKIIELNQIYDPDFIYVDRGYGEYQVEMLHKIGLNRPETRLHEKVKGIAFGGSVKVRDPFTKASENKPIKPFMVNQTNLLLERDRIWLSDHDDMLWKQMENYQVLKVSVTGQPTYTSEWEHALDAFMLSILAFVLEMPNLSQIIESINVARNMGVVKISTPDPLVLLDKENNGLSGWDEPGAPPPKKVKVGSKPSETRSKNSMTWARRGSVEASKLARRPPSRRSW